MATNRTRLKPGEQKPSARIPAEPPPVSCQPYPFQEKSWCCSLCLLLSPDNGEIVAQEVGDERSHKAECHPQRQAIVLGYKKLVTTEPAKTSRARPATAATIPTG